MAVYEKRAPFTSPIGVLAVAGVITIAALTYNTTQCVAGQGFYYCASFWDNPISIIAVAILPVLFFAWLIQQDRLEPEPRLIIALLFGLGAFSTFLAKFLNDTLGEPLYLVGFVEEPAKILGVYCLVSHKRFGKEFNGPMDGLVWGAAAGAGFAIVESVLYFARFFVLGQVYSGGDALGYLIGQTILFRNLAGPGHLVWTGIAAWWLGIAKATRGRNVLPDLIPGLSIAIFLHGFYDFSTRFGLWVFLFVPVNAYLLYKLAKEAHREELVWGYGSGYAPKEPYTSLK